MNITSLFDTRLFGDRATLAFELKVNGEWVSLIPNFSATTGMRVLRQYDQEVDASLLPSSCRLFRAKLDVTDALETAVSIIPVG